MSANAPSSAQEHRDPDTVVVLVHGTFSGDPRQAASSPPTPLWWQEGSHFRAVLDREWAARQTEKNCLPTVETFEWTDAKGVVRGPNSERARRDAGNRLYERLIKLERQTPQSRLHLIGHSHGGSVIHHALSRARRRQLENVQSWATAGTPFLQFGVAWNDFCIAWANFFLFLALSWALMWSDVAKPIVDSKNPLLELVEIVQNEQEFMMTSQSAWWKDGANWVSVGLTLALALAAIYLCRRALVKYRPKRTVLSLLGGVVVVVAACLASWLLVFCGIYFLFWGGGVSDDQGVGLTSLFGPAAYIAVAAALLWLVVLATLAWRAVLVAVAALRQISRISRLRRATSRFEARWIAFVHPADEALTLVAASLQRPPSLSMRGRESGVTEAEAPLLDQAAWRTLTELVQGDDCPNERLIAVSPAPCSYAGLLPVLRCKIAARLQEVSAERLVETTHVLWTRLFAEGRLANFADGGSLFAKLSFSGAVHIAYLAAPPSGLVANSDAAADIAAEISKDIVVNALLRGRPGPVGNEMTHWSALTDMMQWRNLQPVRRSLPTSAGQGEAPSPALSLVRASARRLWLLSLGVGAAQAALVASVTMVVGFAMLSHAAPLLPATALRDVAKRAVDDMRFLASTDASLSASFAVLSAAVHGNFMEEQKIKRLLAALPEQNVSNAVAQRLAFYYGVRNDQTANAAAQVLLGVYEDEKKLAVMPRDRGGRSGVSWRQLELVRFSHVLGRAMAQGALLDQEAEAFERAVRSIRSANGRATPLFACGDTDLPGVLALQFLAQTMAGRVQAARETANEAARLKVMTCREGETHAPSENEHNEFDLALRRFLLDRAADLGSWGHADRARDALSLAGLGEDRSKGALTLFAAELYERQSVGGKLRCNARRKELATLLDKGAHGFVWSSAGDGQAAICRYWRARLADGLSTEALSEATIWERVVRDCRGAPDELLRAVRIADTRRVNACESREEAIENVLDLMRALPADSPKIDIAQLLPAPASTEAAAIAAARQVAAWTVHAERLAAEKHPAAPMMAESLVGWFYRYDSRLATRCGSEGQADMKLPFVEPSIRLRVTLIRVLAARPTETSGARKADRGCALELLGEVISDTNEEIRQLFEAGRYAETIQLRGVYGEIAKAWLASDAPFGFGAFRDNVCIFLHLGVMLIDTGRDPKSITLPNVCGPPRLLARSGDASVKQQAERPLLHASFRIEPEFVGLTLQLLHKAGAYSEARRAQRLLRTIADGSAGTDNKLRAVTVLRRAMGAIGNQWAALRASELSGASALLLSAYCDALLRGVHDAKAGDAGGLFNSARRWPGLIPSYYDFRLRFTFAARDSGPFTCDPSRTVLVSEDP